MNFLGGAILLSTVLYLVDKNQKWKMFWRATLSLTALAIALGVGYWQYTVYASAKNMEHRQKIAARERAECTQGDVFDQAACVHAIEQGPAPSAAVYPPKP